MDAGGASAGGSLLGRGTGAIAHAIAHLRSFLGRCSRIERDRREAHRPQMGGTHDPRDRARRLAGRRVPRRLARLVRRCERELRFFEDWDRSSAASERVYDHWALDTHDYELRGEREVGFIPRPRRFPSARLLADPTLSAQRLMERAAAIDREIGYPFAWFFLMTHGFWVDPDVGQAIATGLSEQRVRLPERDARALLRWDEARYHSECPSGRGRASSNPLASSHFVARRSLWNPAKAPSAERSFVRPITGSTEQSELNVRVRH
jgi:hypothetical protein